MKTKILIIGDSSVNPRPIPVKEKTTVEETFPYLLREKYPSAQFYQISYGGVTTADLISQALSYLSDWEPEYIIVMSGMADCKPEAYSEYERKFIELISRSRLFGKLTNYFLKQTTEIKLRKLRQKYRVKPQVFERPLRQLKLVFSDSKIFWLGLFISDNGEYEKIRPGMNQRMKIYGELIQKHYGKNYIEIQQALNEGKGICSDNEHLNKIGHKIIADILEQKINEK